MDIEKEIKLIAEAKTGNKEMATQVIAEKCQSYCYGDCEA